MSEIRRIRKKGVKLETYWSYLQLYSYPCVLSIRSVLPIGHESMHTGGS